MGTKMIRGLIVRGFAPPKFLGGLPSAIKHHQMFGWPIAATRILIGADIKSGHVNWHVFIDDGSGTATMIDLGIQYPITGPMPSVEFIP